MKNPAITLAQGNDMPTPLTTGISALEEFNPDEVYTFEAQSIASFIESSSADR